jgi:hypothetical protein
VEEALFIRGILVRHLNFAIKCLVVYIIFLSVPAFSQAQDSLSPSPASSTGNPSPTSTLKTEVSGFVLQGKKLFEILNIEDLDTVALPDGKRLIPLLRLLKALEIPVEKKDDALNFSPNPSVKIALDLERKEIQINDKTKPLYLVVGVSDVTLEQDVFLLTEVVGEILSMDIQWDNQMYRFQAKTDQKLSIWSQQNYSLFSIATNKIQADLPSLLPPAQPQDFTLDFMELKIQPDFTMYPGSRSANTVTIESPTQSFWGNAFGGRYRMQFTEPNISWGSYRFKTNSSPVMLNRGDWVYHAPNTEITAGDSVFGLNDMILPIIRMTGVRYNGESGFPEDKTLWPISPGLASTITSPQAFAGTAPAGSKVELVINDQRIQTQDILVDTYRFDDILLAPGSLSRVQIIITEPSGYQRVIEQDIYGKDVNLPRGALTFVSGLGTNRTIYDWSSRGLLGGGKISYGVTDTLTLSATFAAQDNFYLPISIPAMNSLNLPERDYPRSSFHVGGQAIWLPSEYFLFSGDMAMSNGSNDNGAHDRLAFKIKGEVNPSQNIQIGSEFFHYGLDFFNGENLSLHDREGYFLYEKWRINRNWIVSSTAGSAGNNLKHKLDNTLRADFQNLEIASNIIPSVTITGGVTRNSFSWEDDGPKTLYTLKFQGNLFKGISFDAASSLGSFPNITKAMDFFTGLRIQGLSLYRPPTVSASLYMPITAEHTLGISYWDDANRDRPSILHNYTSQSKPIRIYSEIGYDFKDKKPYISNRLYYSLDSSGKSMLGHQITCERGKWEFHLFLSVDELFSFSRGKVTRVADSTSVTPGNAGVHGRVFIDANANGIMDPEESGIKDVQVILDDIYKATTDADGYFILPSLPQHKQCKVFINIDTVPANYTPTHALQTAYLNPAGLTEVNLGISPAHSISGTVQETTPDGDVRPLLGIRVYLTKVNEDKALKDSITGEKGSYFLGDLRPGQYYMHIDSETISPQYVFRDPKKIIEILPAMEAQELNIPPLMIIRKSKEMVPDLLPPVMENASKPVIEQ